MRNNKQTKPEQIVLEGIWTPTPLAGLTRLKPLSFNWVNKESPHHPEMSLLGLHPKELKMGPDKILVRQYSYSHYSQEPKSGNNPDVCQHMNV
jgi:hypothetical protein